MADEPMNRQQRRNAANAGRKKGRPSVQTPFQRAAAAREAARAAGKEYVHFDSPAPAAPAGEAKNVTPRSGLGHGKGRYLIPVGIGGAAAAGYLVHRHRRKPEPVDKAWRLPKGNPTNSTIGGRRRYLAEADAIGSAEMIAGAKKVLGAPKAASKLASSRWAARSSAAPMATVNPAVAAESAKKAGSAALGTTRNAGGRAKARWAQRSGDDVAKYFLLDPFSKAQDDDKWWRRARTGALVYPVGMPTTAASFNIGHRSGRDKGAESVEDRNRRSSKHKKASAGIGAGIGAVSGAGLNVMRHAGVYGGKGRAALIGGAGGGAGGAGIGYLSGVLDSWAYGQGRKQGAERSVKKSNGALPTNVRSVAPVFNRSGTAAPGLKLLKVHGTGPRPRKTEAIHIHNDHTTVRGKGHGSRISKSATDDAGTAGSYAGMNIGKALMVNPAKYANDARGSLLLARTGVPTQDLNETGRRVLRSLNRNSRSSRVRRYSADSGPMETRGVSAKRNSGSKASWKERDRAARRAKQPSGWEPTVGITKADATRAVGLWGRMAASGKGEETLNRVDRLVPRSNTGRKFGAGARYNGNQLADQARSSGFAPSTGRLPWN